MLLVCIYIITTRGVGYTVLALKGAGGVSESTKTEVEIGASAKFPNLTKHRTVAQNNCPGLSGACG